MDLFRYAVSFAAQSVNRHTTENRTLISGDPPIRSIHLERRPAIVLARAPCKQCQTRK